MTLDNFLVPNVMHGQFGLFSPAESEQPKYGATQLFLLSSYVHCFCVSIPPAVGPIRLRQMVMMGSLTWAHGKARVVHMYKEVCAKVDSEG